MAMNLFAGGYLPLEQRSWPRTCSGRSAARFRGWRRQLDSCPRSCEGLDALLSDTYFCNFSLFQSMPDSWAIKQLFPVMPIHRLDERPTRHAVLGDITCDSDGKIDQFIDRRDVKRTLPLHAFNGEPYYLGAFLVGAYQEILGDMHNLFGDTNAVHVSLDDDGEVVLEAVIKGDTVREVLDYVEFDVERPGAASSATTSRLAVREGRASTTKKPAASCASTKTACKATRTWKSPRTLGPARFAALGEDDDAGATTWPGCARPTT